MMIFLRPALFAVATLLAGCMSAPPALDLSLSRATAPHGIRAEIKPLTEPVPLQKLHAWELKLSTPDGQPVTGARITVDGGMPQHHHGLPTQPRVTKDLGNGRYLIEGVKFSMSGWWEIKLAIEGPNGTDKVTFNLVLPES
ncbi:FixH family protein [Massilia endophytica]|uniref:FixH family protein n=1 Tax=Massilia endophytica TaxID=2899220 RepID=UPI001E40C084|nr:FixH family protein [Massilia endophytica]UGQ49136.1 FixH family protein [Massilia endophytica]